MENEEIDLKDILQLFWNKKIIIVITTAIAIVFGLIYTMYFKEPKYTSKTSLVLAQQESDGSSKAVTQTDVTLNDKLIATYKELAKRNSILREVISNLKLTDMTESQLKSEINVSTVKETQILEISVTDSNPELAQKIANELSDVFVKKVSEIFKIDNINMVDEAEFPTSPSNIHHSKDIIVFTAIGFALSIGIILIINLLDTTIKNANDIEKISGLFVIAEVPQCDFNKKK